MTIYAKLTVGAINAPLATWDSSTQIWDSTTATWDDLTTVNIGVPFYDTYNMQLKKSTADNNSSSRLDMLFPNNAGIHAADFATTAEVFLYADKDINPPTTLRFGGVITEKTFEGSGSNKEKIKLMARDFTAILQKNSIEPTVFTNQEVSVIVINLMQSFAPTSFTTANVQVTGLTIDRITFKQVYLFDALKQLAELAKCVFWVDSTKDLHFVPLSTASSGLTFNNTNVRKSQFVTDVDSVKNKVMVYGNRQLVAQPTETFTSNGAGSVFTLTLNPVNVSVRSPSGGNILKGDVFNAATTAASGIDFLVSYYDKTVILRSGTSLGYTTIPASGTKLTVDYFVSRPIVKSAEDPTSQQAYYKRTDIIQDDNINDPLVAKRIAKNQITLKKDPAIQGMLDMQGVIDVTPGNTVIVDLPLENVSSQTYDILEASYNFTPALMQAEQVLKVKVSQRIKDITDILKDMINKQRLLQASQIDSTAVVTRLLTGNGSAGLQIPSWHVKTKAINDTFVLGHTNNGVLGIVGGKGLTGSMISTVSWISGIMGTGYDRAVGFGSGGRIFVTDNGSRVNIGSKDNYSVSFWFAKSGNATDCSISEHNQATNYPWAFKTSGGLNFTINDGTTTPIARSGNFIDGSWYHVVGVRNYTAGSISLYVNGSLVNTALDSTNGNVRSTTGGFTLGARLSTGTHSFIGSLDDFRVYNKILSTGEIGSLYSKLNVTGSLLAYYKFDEGLLTTVYSSSSGTDYKLQPILGDRRSAAVTVTSGVT